MFNGGGFINLTCKFDNVKLRGGPSPQFKVKAPIRRRHMVEVRRIALFLIKHKVKLRRGSPYCKIGVFSKKGPFFVEYIS